MKKYSSQNKYSPNNPPIVLRQRKKSFSKIKPSSNISTINNYLNNTSNLNTNQNNYQNTNQNQNKNNQSPLSRRKSPQKILTTNMYVAVRVRPLSQKELDESNYKTITINSDNTLNISIPTEYVPDDKSKIYLGKKDELIKITNTREATFKYDYIFGENSTQNDVYKNTSSNLIRNIVDGYSATIMAYGATGSGKTFTMVGKGDECGIMIRAIRDLFKIVNKDIDKKFFIKISYIEVYNEVLKDLLYEGNVKKNLDLLNDPKKGVVIMGVENKIVNNENEAFKLINKGNKRRTEKCTDRNEYSSRSHAILQIYLEIQDQFISNDNNNNNNQISFGKFILVDLAGSEKSEKINNNSNNNNNNISNNESGSINKSLLALGKCINLLVSQKTKFIPFRESKLTRILQEPLSGNGQIVMIATVSPSIYSFDETMFTLQYANRAKNLKTKLKKNFVENENALIIRYNKIIKSLREQIDEINMEIINENNVSFSENNNSLNNSKYNNTKYNNTKYAHNEKYDQLQKDLINHFQEEIKLKKKIIEKENILEKSKNNLTDQELQMLIDPKINVQVLKNKLESIKNEIEHKSEIIKQDYLKLNEMISERKDFNNTISELSKADPQNAQIQNLFNIYKYYLNLIDNISNEHKKYLNFEEINRKEKKISLLTQQIQIRDNLIQNANNQLIKNKINFDYKNPNYKTLEELEIDPNHPEIIKVSPSFQSLNDINKNTTLNNDKNNSSYDNKLLSKYKNSQNRNERLSNIKQLVNDTKNIVQKNQYNPQLLNSTNNKKSNNVFERNLSSIKNTNNVFVNAGENLMRGEERKRTTDFVIKDNVKSGNLLDNLILEQRKTTPFRNENYLRNINNYNGYGYYSPNVAVSNTTNLENEVQKKVKTILKKDFIGRYKRSPYLHLLNE